MNHYFKVLAIKPIHRSRAQGQGLIEFALVIPILLLLILGLFDLGYAAFLQNTLSNAAREGARTGIVLSTTDAAIRARVRATAAGLSLSDAQIAISPSPSRTFNQPITVTVSYTYTPVTPFIETITGGLAISERSSMIVEGVITP